MNVIIIHYDPGICNRYLDRNWTESQALRPNVIEVYNQARFIQYR